MKKVYLLAIILVLVLFAKMACADQISFGSVGHSQRVTMILGSEPKTFKLYFFNYGDNPLKVKIEKTGGDEIFSVVSPTHFVLENQRDVINPMEEEGWVALGDKYIKTVPVRVILKVPDNVSEITKNHHVVKIITTATSDTENEKGVKGAMSQVHEYSYSVYVPGNIKAKTMEEYNESLEKFYEELAKNESLWSKKEEIEKKKDDNNIFRSLPTGFFSLGNEESDYSGYYLILFILIIIISIFVYRKFRR